GFCCGNGFGCFCGLAAGWVSATLGAGGGVARIFCSVVWFILCRNASRALLMSAESPGGGITTSGSGSAVAATTAGAGEGAAFTGGGAVCATAFGAGEGSAEWTGAGLCCC